VTPEAGGTIQHRSSACWYNAVLTLFLTLQSNCRRGLRTFGDDGWPIKQRWRLQPGERGHLRRIVPLSVPWPDGAERHCPKRIGV
jgi:hypothetical protein